MIATIRTGLLACAGALALFAAPFAHAQDLKWDEVVAAAKKEGKLTIYNGTNFAIIRKIAAEFTKKHGIRVDVLDARATEIRERIRVEQSTNRTVASLSYSGWTTLSTQQAEGVWQNLGGIPNLSRLEEPVKGNGVLVPTVIGKFALLVNTNLVKPEEEPKVWADLLHPRWKGKILSDDPRAAGAGNVWFEVLLTKFGREFHEKFAAQGPVFNRLFPESQRRLARGEFALYLPFNVSEFAGLKGLPVKPIIPQEGLPYVPFAFAILRDAPDANAARLFIDYNLSDEAQALYANEGFTPAVPAAPAKVPADLKLFVDAKLLGTTTVGKQNEMFDAAKAIYK
jgi:iron(III) transport system substrate-binding protein